MEEANYRAYLKSVYPSTTWTLELLSGGLVNTTMRATRISGPDCVPESLILKHARPYVQAEGPEMAFSIQRQDIEAAMLTLVHSEDGPAGNITRAERQRHFPCLLRHDQGTEASLGLTTEENESSILLLTDLGSLVDCLEFLTINAETFVSDNIPSLLGDSVGKILAGFHTTELQNAPAPLRNDFTKDLVFMAAVKPLETHLAHLPNCQQLCKRVEEDYLHPNYDYPGVLCHGDIHSGSVLITKNGGDAHPVVIDMEFAKLGGRGVNGDVSQFLASIHCGLIAAELNRDDASVAAIANFIKKFCTAYRNGTRWIYSVREGAGNQGAQLMRSCFILHGREMINYAYDSCKVETHRKKMVQIGVWYLEQAADDVEGFTDKRRQEEFKTDTAW